MNKGKAEDLVFNMETGETAKAKKAPETIEEGKEEESDWIARYDWIYIDLSQLKRGSEVQK